MYFAVLVVCRIHQCYLLGTYSARPFSTREACDAAFVYVRTMNYMPRESSLHVLCMTEKERDAMPKYRTRAP